MPANNPHNEQTAFNYNNEISLKELIIGVKKWIYFVGTKWKIIAVFAMIGALLGAGYTFLKKPVYTATTTFVLEGGEKGEGMSQFAGLGVMVGLDLSGKQASIFQGDNILELYKSRVMIQKTLLSPVIIDGKPQSLMERYIAINNLKQSWANNPELLAIKFQSDSLYQYRNTSNIYNKNERLKDSVLREAVADIKKNYLTAIKPDKKLNIIKVDIRSKDEQFSKLFNNKIVQTVNNFYYYTKIKKTSENIKVLKAKADSVRAEMNGAIYSSFNAFDATPNLNQTRQKQRMVPQQKAQFSTETNKAILGTLVQNLELAKISMQKEAPLIQVIDEPIYPLSKEKLGMRRGIVLGGFIFAALSVMIIMIKKFYKSVLND